MNEMVCVFSTPLGNYRLTYTSFAILALDRSPDAPILAPSPSDAIAQAAIKQLREYFDGLRQNFTLPLDPHGTEFQRRVWKALCEIPYGETQSYAEIASAVGNPKACRAVGLANHRNPISILIPCHRVIGADGSLVGYGGGLNIKRSLLELEQRVLSTGSKGEKPC